MTVYGKVPHRKPVSHDDFLADGSLLESALQVARCRCPSPWRTVLNCFPCGLYSLLRLIWHDIKLSDDNVRWSGLKC